MIRNATRREAAYANRKHPTVAKVINKGELSAAKQKKIDDMEENAHLVGKETAVKSRRKATAAVAAERVADLCEQFGIGAAQASPVSSTDELGAEYASVDNSQKLIIDF